MELFRKIIVTIVQEEINTYRNSDMGGAGGQGAGERQTFIERTLVTDFNLTVC